MRVRCAALILQALLGSAFFTTAAAGAHPHARTGFLVGFGTGLGTLQNDLIPGYWHGTGLALAADFRLGWALRPDLTVGYESAAVWGDLGFCSVHTAGITYYPRNFGFYVRAGAGFGVVTNDRVVLLPKVAPPDGRRGLEGRESVADNRRGVGFLGAVGYEFRLTRRFALAPQANWIFVGVGPDRIHTRAKCFATQLNWYW